MENFTTLEEKLSTDALISNSTLPLPPDMVFGDAQIISIAAYTPLFVISATLNLRVLGNLLRVKERTGLSRLNQLLLHLVLADLSVTFLMMPLEIAWAMTVSWWAGDFLCRICSFFRIFGLFLSSNIVVCISIDRFLAILRPFSVRGSSKRIKWMLAVAWGMAVILEFLYFFMGMVFLYIIPLIVILLTYGGIIFHLHRKDVRWTKDEEDQGSPTSPGEPENDIPVDETKVKSKKPFLLTSMRPKCSNSKMTSSPITITTTMSMPAMSMSCTERPSNLLNVEQDLETQSSNRLRSPSATPMVIRRSNPGMIGKAKLNTIKITMTLVGVFLACWTPYYVLCIWFWVAPESYSKIDYRIQKFLFLYACTNSCANPLIYGAFTTNGAGIFSNKERTPNGRRWLSQRFQKADNDDRQRASSASVVLHRKRSSKILRSRNLESEAIPLKPSFRINFKRQRLDASEMDDPKQTRRFSFMEMKNLRRSSSTCRQVPINITVNVHVNGLKVSDCDIEARITRNKRTLVSGTEERYEEVIERIDPTIKEVSSSAENDSQENKFKDTEL